MPDEVAKRQANYNMLKRQLEIVKKHSPTAPISKQDALILLERVNKIMAKAEESHDRIILTCADEAAIDTQVEKMEIIEDVYRQARSLLQDILDSYTTAATIPQPHRTPKVKLPILELPTFDGNFNNWTSFQDLFDASIHSNKELTDGQKLQYLKSAVKSEAASLIKSIQITNANYQEAWDILKSRYNNNREIVSSVLERLFGPKSIMTESPQDLQCLLDNARECIRTLKVLKRPVQHWDDVLLHFHLKKIDPESRRQWALRLNGTDIPTFEDFITFLENHIRGLFASGASNLNSTAAGGRAGGRQIAAHLASTEPTCPICKHTHLIFKCSEFTSKSPKDRNALVKRLQLCFNCLRNDHKIMDCKNHRTCKKCSRRHHTMLHSDNAPAQAAAYTSSQAQQAGGSSTSTKPQGGASASQGLISNHCNSEDDKQVLLATAQALAEHNGHNTIIRIVLDGGSQGTFISEECVRKLNLKRMHSTIQINGVGDVNAGSTKGKVCLTIKSLSTGVVIPITAYVLPKISRTLPSYPFSTDKWSHLQGLQLADPYYNKPGRVDLLLDAAYTLQLETGGIIKGPTMEAPGAKHTLLGWVVTGTMPSQSSTINSFNVRTSPDLDAIWRKFWEVEEPPRIKYLSPEEESCEDFFEKTHKRDNNGRFVVRLQFNEKKNQLGESRSMAVRRLLSVERRLERQPEHKAAYHKFMQEYESLGHMEPVPQSEAREVIGKTNYLPHHFVTNSSSTTTKLRVVFDGSARTSTNVSLNDTLMVGPTLQDDLYDILLRIRVGKVVIKADMVKFFRQFLVETNDCDMQRIVWRNDKTKQIVDYRLRTPTYGTGPATYLSTKCMDKLAATYAVSHPLASSVLKSSTYVDDIMHSANSTEEGAEVYRQLTMVANSAKVPLGKWATNDPELLKLIPAEQRETELVLGIDKNCNIKALGVQWNPSLDVFKFKINPTHQAKIITKRVLLSELAKVFDPLGLITPITIRAKLLMQDLWKIKLDWDQELPENMKLQWKEYTHDLLRVPELTIPRWISTEDIAAHEIHGFADSSERALGVVLYLKTVTSSGNIKVEMITSKSRVAPIKQISLPKLELCAATELSELINHVRSVLKLNCKIYCWSDSTITLHWISGLPYRWKTYVANKVAKIQRATEASCWRHVPGNQNPADLVSRGVPSSQLINDSFWWNGPDFLHQKELPKFTPPPFDDSVELYEKKTINCNLATGESIINKKYSSLFTTQRILAYVLRFISNTRKPQRKSATRTLTTQEVQTALTTLLREAQAEMFSRELKSLRSGAPVHPKSKLITLKPFINNSGLICVGGRLQHAHVPERSKHQIILQHDHHLTQLIIRHHHLHSLHGGFQVTWAALQREYWILRGRDSVRLMIRKCIICRRFRAENIEQVMGNLPSPRVTLTRPFLNTGIDYCGPFYLRTYRERKPLIYKAYISVFICMATKAIHLEAVSDLTTETFIATLRRFVARRGICLSLHSDNGTNFQGADGHVRVATVKTATSEFERSIVKLTPLLTNDA